MQIKNVVNSQIIQRQQNFKGSSANSSPFLEHPEYKPIPLDTSQAYASPQITQGYRELETFDVPYVGKGKLYELSNGHKIIIVPKPSKTYISTIVGAGFSDEPADKKDIAHLTEHILANHWYNADSNSDITKTLKETGTSSNAATSNCSTAYHMSANVQDNTDLEKLIKIQLKTLSNDNFSQNEIQKEKDTIIEEAKENEYFIKSDRIAYNQTLKNLFNLESSNGLASDGTSKKIESITQDDLNKFYNDYYRPDNMTTIIVGNVDTNSIKTISKYLSKMPYQKTKLQRQNISNIQENRYISQFKRSDIESPDKNNEFWGFINLSFVGPKLNNIEDTENMMVLSKIIKNRLKEKNINLDVEIPSISKDANIPQVISINGQILEEKSEDNISEIQTSINNLLNNPISPEELNKAKEEIFEDLSSNLEDNASLSWYLNDKLLSNSKMNIEPSFNHLKNVPSINIQNTAKKYLDLNKASMVVIHPQKEPLQKNTAVSFKGLAELTDTKDIKEYDLPNNLHVIFDTRPGIVKTAVSCNFVFENQQKNNKGIIDALQSSLVTNENEEWPVGNWIDNEGITIKKFGASENIQDIINDIKKDLTNPEFKQDKLDGAKKYQKEYLKKERRIYPRDLLEGSSFPQNENEICPEWIKTNDLKVYYNHLLSQSQGTIIITIPKEKLQQVESELLKSLSEIPNVKHHDISTISNQYNTDDLGKNSIFLNKQDNIDKIKIEKEFKITDNGDVKDEAGIMLLNSVLNEKLGKSLRDNLGLTYGANSYYEKHNSKFGVMTIMTEIAKAPLVESSKIAITQIENVINHLATTQMDGNILNDTKKQIKSNLLIPAETSVDRNASLESNYKISYDINYSKKLAEALDGLTPSDIQALAQKLLAKHYLLEVSGNKNVIESNKDYLASLGEIVN